MNKKKDWIQNAVKHPGAFTRYCKEKGFKGVTDECIAMGCRDKNKVTKRRACLAKVFRKIAYKNK